MANLKETRKKLGIVFAGLGVLCVVALGVLFSPLVGSEKDRLQELDQLRIQLRQKQQQVERVGDIDKKIATAGQQIDSFYKDRLPNRYSAISENLGKLANESGVRLEQAKYTPDKNSGPSLLPIEVEANLSGSYPQLARFLNSLERSQLFFIVDAVDLAGEQNNQAVKLQMKLRTFLRTGA
jgi:Tfp pilus assembly protein PilO